MGDLLNKSGNLTMHGGNLIKVPAGVSPGSCDCCFGPTCSGCIGPLPFVVRLDLDVSICTGCYNVCTEFGDGGAVAGENIRDISGSYCLTACSGDTKFYFDHSPPFFNLYSDFNCSTDLGPVYHENPGDSAILEIFYNFSSLSGWSISCFFGAAGGVNNVGNLQEWFGNSGSMTSCPTGTTVTLAPSSGTTWTCQYGTCDGYTNVLTYYQINSMTLTPYPLPATCPTSSSSSSSSSSGAMMLKQKLSGPDLWGPPLWKLLHMRATYFEKTKVKEEMEWLKQFGKLLPCGMCQQDYLKYLAQHPPVLTSEYAYLSWTVELHNYVNTKLDKPVMTTMEAAKALGIDASWLRAAALLLT